MSIAQRRNHAYGQRSYIGFRVALAPIVADRKWPAARAVPPRTGVDILAPTKSSPERLAAFMADAAVTEELYKEIVAADQLGILVSLDKKPERAVGKLYALQEDLFHRTSRLNRGDEDHRPLTVGELGLFLLAGSDPQMPKSIACEKGFSTVKGSTELVLDEPKSRRLLLRQLLKSWMLVWVPGKKEFNTIAQFYQLKEVASELALMAVAPDTKPELRFNCLYTLINLGSEKELETLSKLLKNEDKVPEELFRRTAGPLGGRLPQQWRDLALLVMIRIAGDDPNDYGFAKRTEETQPSRYDMDLAFRDEPARKDAFEKWQKRATKMISAATKQSDPKQDSNVSALVEQPKDAGKLPLLPGKAPVFARITKVDPEKCMFDFILLFDEIVNTETIVTDGQGKTLKQSSDRVMTSRIDEKTDRPLRGSIASTGDGQIIPNQNLLKNSPVNSSFSATTSTDCIPFTARCWQPTPWSSKSRNRMA